MVEVVGFLLTNTHNHIWNDYSTKDFSVYLRWVMEYYSMRMYLKTNRQFYTSILTDMCINKIANKAFNCMESLFTGTGKCPFQRTSWVRGLLKKSIDPTLFISGQKFSGNHCQIPEDR